jgi:ketosteroid isomerase-like protein
MTTPELDPVAATLTFLDLLEAREQDSVVAMLESDITWTTPMTATGDADDAEVIEGREAFRARLALLGAMISSVRFTDRRVTVDGPGTTTFVQARGDFRTAAGRPYRNTYVFRLDWRDGRIRSWEEYANPVTVLNAFPELASGS